MSDAVYVGIRYGVMPSMAVILKIWSLVAATYGIGWIVLALLLLILLIWRNRLK
mgnify:CR=1 FL=1